MKLLPSGTLRDHSQRPAPYRLARGYAGAGEWVCSIDPLQTGLYNVTGQGKNHATAVRKALASWKEYDAARAQSTPQPPAPPADHP